MKSSQEILADLLARHDIRVANGAFLHTSPAALPADFKFSRVSGMLLGLAVGDALGNSTEGRFKDRVWKPGEDIRNYLTHPRWGDRRGYPSDDSQMAFWTMEQILADGRFVPDHLMRIFTTREIFGIGGTLTMALSRYEARWPWHQCGLQSAGNGALMRIAPILVPHLRSRSTELWADTALCTMLTHNDSMAISSSVAFVRVLWELLGRNSAPHPSWWAETFVSVLSELECDENYEVRNPVLTGLRGPLWRFLEHELDYATSRHLSIREACDRWYSGAYLLETVPAVLYILMQYAHDPEEAIVRAVNDSWDNDTIGAIVGAAVGALHGREGLPERWLAGLSGRTAATDEGRMFELIEAAELDWKRGQG